MALQEKYFCSFVQRVLDEPLDMRLHYGHPDLLDKVHFLTRGGVSKARYTHCGRTYHGSTHSGSTHYGSTHYGYTPMAPRTRG